MKTEFVIKNARLSFPSLFESEVYEGKPTGKFGATFILDNAEHAAVIKELKTSARELIKTELKGKAPDRKYMCLKTSASYDTERPEYENSLMVRAMNKRRPLVVGPDKNHVIPGDPCEPYSGCYVNVKVSLWAKKTKGGPSLGANLITVQFAKDGEAFDGSYISEEDALKDFDEMEPGEGFDETFDSSNPVGEDDDLF